MPHGHSILNSIVDNLAPVHADGYKFVAIGGGLALLFFLLWAPLGWMFAAITAWMVYFFRDPARTVPVRDGLIVSAADGKITGVDKVRPPEELGLGTDERVRVSTFLSVFDVHIQRAPVAGKLVRSVYVPGAFLNAALDKASEENERRAIVIATPTGPEIGCVQIAGLIARRIVTFAREGDTLGMGQRYGLIRFGSRVDVYLPPGKTALVSVGQRAVGGETVFADLRSDEPVREVRRV